MSVNLKGALLNAGLSDIEARSFLSMLNRVFLVSAATEYEQVRVVKTLEASIQKKKPMSPDLESPDSVKQLRALAADTAACTYAYGPDLRKAADEIERLRWQLKEYERGI